MEAARTKPDFAEAHFDLGFTYIDMNDKGASEEGYKILRKPNSALADRL